MMLFFQIACLCVTLIVLQTYIVTGVFSRTHRLLPLVLGLIGVYNFYQIIQTITGEQELFSKMKDMLLIQMIYLLLHYMLDVIHIKPSHAMEIILFLILLAANISVFLCYNDASMYKKNVLMYVAVFLTIILLIGTYTYLKYSFTKRDYFVSSMLYVAFLIPAITISVCRLYSITNDIAVPLALAITCLIVLYLLKTRQLEDPQILLQERIYDTSDVPMLLYNKDYCLLASNVAAKSLFKEELAKQKYGTETSVYKEKIFEMLYKPERRMEIKIRGRFYECKAHSVSAYGVVEGYAVTFLDITGQKHEVKHMENLKDEAERQAVYKSKFLARMSHDLRSPLYAIVGISDILLGQKRLTEKQRTLILHQKNAGNTLLERVNSIMNFSKLEAGKLELARNSYDMETLVREVANICVLNLRAKQVKLTIAFVTEYPTKVIGDDFQVKEILQNILSNAAKHTMQGEIRCEVSCKMKEAQKQAEITFRVKDSGTGIKPEFLDKLFDEYTSFEGDVGIQGSGLGLPIVKQLAERMGGYVMAESDGKSGSTVTVAICQEVDTLEMRPAQVFDSEVLMWHSVKEMPVLTPLFVYPKAKVLMADDMQVNQEIFRELLRPWEFEIVTVSSGQEAILAAQTENFQLIFLDQMMPQMTGMQTAKKLHSLCDTPLILLTADTSDEIRAECKACGFVGYLAKPIELERLQKMLERYIPIEYRQNRQNAFETSTLSWENGRKLYEQTLKDYVQEILPLMEKLPEYMKSDLELFRIKIHGIKGVARQLGKMDVWEVAEILEMAAKTKNEEFLLSHWDEFAELVWEDLRFSQKEIERMPKMQTQCEEADMGTKEEEFLKLQEAFDSYDIVKIESCVERLAKMSLAEEEQTLLKRIADAADDLDYERGMELLGEWTTWEQKKY